MKRIFAGLVLVFVAAGCQNGAGAHPVADEAKVAIVIAAVDIDEGTTVTKDMLEQRTADATLITSSVVKPDSVSYVLGARVLVPVQKGDPMLWSQFESKATAKTGTALVANADLPEGTTLTLAQFRERAIEADLATSSVVKPESATMVVGHMLLVPMQKGDLLLWSQVASQH